MELFVINRYTGEEPKPEETPNKEKLRRKLLKQIDKRKRQSELSVDQENQYKHKKRKENEVVEETETANTAESKKESEDEKEFEENEHSITQSSVEPSNESKNFKKKKKKTKLKEEITENGQPEENRNEEGVENEKQETGFTILGDVHMSKKEKVKRKLPNWLANPSVVSVDLKNLTCTVDSIPELDKIFVDKLKENGITHFFPVQSQLIPWLLRNSERPKMYWSNDVCVSAPTGSGKTLAFVLPILQILYKRIVPKIRALVVLPVQDLANQVFNVFETYSKSTNLNVLLLSKKRTFEEEQSLICKKDSMGNYRTMVDIIVTTPGRLVDHLTKTKGLCLDYLTYLVIDEADRVMENVQNDWLYHLNKHMNSECIRSYQIPIISYNNMVNRKKPPNKLLFSATLSQDPEKLQQLGLFQPKLFTSIVKSKNSNETSHEDESKFLGKYTTPAELTEFYINVTKANKPLILHHLLKSRSWNNVLCFVNSSEATSRLAFVLKALSQEDIKIGKLSASLTIKKRNTVLTKFSEGKLNVLISSDALARGIDIPNVQYVISYDAPKYIKTYIHRIGRTGRAGREGTSVTLLTPKEKNEFQKMIEIAGKTSVKELNINIEDLEQYQSGFEEALKSLGTVLEKKKEKTLLKMKIKKKLNLKAAKGTIIKSKKKIKKPKADGLNVLELSSGAV